MIHRHVPAVEQNLVRQRYGVAEQVVHTPKYFGERRISRYAKTFAMLTVHNAIEYPDSITPNSVANFVEEGLGYEFTHRRSMYIQAIGGGKVKKGVKSLVNRELPVEWAHVDLIRQEMVVSSYTDLYEMKPRTTRAALALAMSDIVKLEIQSLRGWQEDFFADLENQFSGHSA